MKKTIKLKPWTKVVAEFKPFGNLPPERQNEIILTELSGVIKQEHKKRDTAIIKERLIFWIVVIAMFMLLFSIRSNV